MSLDGRAMIILVSMLFKMLEENAIKFNIV